MEACKHGAESDKTDATASTSAKGQQRSEDIQQPGPEEITGPHQGATAFQIYMLKVESEELMNSSSYSQAVEHLSRLHNLQPNHIETLLMLAKCYFFLDKYDACFGIVKKIRGILLKPPRPQSRDLLVRVDKCEGTERFIFYVLKWCCCSLFMTECPESALERIQEYISWVTALTSMHNRFSSMNSRMFEDVRVIINRIRVGNRKARTCALLHYLGCEADSACGLDKCCEAGKLFNESIKRLQEQPLPSSSSEMLKYGATVATSGFVYNANRDFAAAFLKAESILKGRKHGTPFEIEAKRNGLKSIKEELEEIRAMVRLDEPGGVRGHLLEGGDRAQRKSLERAKSPKMLRFFHKEKDT